jgi:hypothetical protein
MKASFGLVLLLSVLTLTAVSQSKPHWGQWSWLIGEWVGEGSGNPEQGNGFFSLVPDLDSHILVRKSHSEYPAANAKPAVIHDDLLTIYPDTAGSGFKAIYFDNEGHVINYRIVVYEKTITLTSDTTSSRPVFRLVYTNLGQDMINVSFGISQDGEKFITYVEGKCSRKK